MHVMSHNLNSLNEKCGIARAAQLIAKYSKSQELQSVNKVKMHHKTVF